MLYTIHTYMFVPYDATLSKQNNTLQMHTTSTSMCLLLLITDHCLCKKRSVILEKLPKF